MTMKIKNDSENVFNKDSLSNVTISFTDFITLLINNTVKSDDLDSIKAHNKNTYTNQEDK